MRHVFVVCLCACVGALICACECVDVFVGWRSGFCYCAQLSARSPVLRLRVLVCVYLYACVRCVGCLSVCVVFVIVLSCACACVCVRAGLLSACI